MFRTFFRFKSSFPISSKNISSKCIFSKQILDGDSYPQRICFVASPLLWRCNSRKLSSYSAHSSADFVDEVSVTIDGGLPVFRVPLPSRNERCQIILKPISHTVDNLLESVKQEDGGVDRIALYTLDGCRISKSTHMDAVLRQDFQLQLNDRMYHVPAVLPRDVTTLASEAVVGDVNKLIIQLYSALNIEEHQREQERLLKMRVEDLKMKLKPMEEIKLDLAERARKRTRMLAWGGLGYMGVQFGFLARLTWWEYSWDIMEPVTYFITYGTGILFYAYFVLTQADAEYSSIGTRKFWSLFHKYAQKKSLDVNHYNLLRTQLLQAELELARLRDPLQLNLPLPALSYADLATKNLSETKTYKTESDSVIPT